jgi:hypothetical protein
VYTITDNDNLKNVFIFLFLFYLLFIHFFLIISLNHLTFVLRCPALLLTTRRLGEVAFHKSVQRDDFDFLELSAETSAISPNR